MEIQPPPLPAHCPQEKSISMVDYVMDPARRRANEIARFKLTEDALKLAPSKRHIPIERWMREQLRERTIRYSTIIIAIWLSIPILGLFTYFEAREQWGHTEALTRSGLTMAGFFLELIAAIIIHATSNRMLIADTRVQYWRAVCKHFEIKDHPAVMLSPLLDKLALVYGYYCALRILLMLSFAVTLLFAVAFPVFLLIAIVTIGMIKFIFEWLGGIAKESRWKEFVHAAERSTP